MPRPSTAIPWSDWRVILLASLGGALEFYDFVVYSQFAQYIGQNFYPNDDKMVSLVVSFSVFAVGYLARPIGGVFFSHIGDRIGRRRVLIITILTMSAATVGIGLLPTYAQWGVTASFALVLLRIVQGFCVCAQYFCRRDHHRGHRVLLRELRRRARGSAEPDRAQHADG